MDPRQIGRRSDSERDVGLSRAGRNSCAEDRDAHTRIRDLLNNTGHQAVITADSSRKQVIYDVVNGGAGTTLL